MSVHVQRRRLRRNINVNSTPSASDQPMSQPCTRLSSADFSVDQSRFRVDFSQEDGQIFATLIPLNDEMRMFGLHSMIWLRWPRQLLESMASGESFSTGGEFCSIDFNDGPCDADLPVGVTIVEDDDSLTVKRNLFANVVTRFVRLHLKRAGMEKILWLARLPSAQQAEIVGAIERGFMSLD